MTRVAFMLVPVAALAAASVPAPAQTPAPASPAPSAFSLVLSDGDSSLEFNARRESGAVAVFAQAAAPVRPAAGSRATSRIEWAPPAATGEPMATAPPAPPVRVDVPHLAAPAEPFLPDVYESKAEAACGP
jgi:hypothetical protein